MMLRQEIVKRLMLEYQQEKDKIVFAKILKRVDHLLLYIIYNLLRARPHLRKVQVQELYHEAVVGLSRAALSMKRKEDAKFIPARIGAYVKLEIGKTYKYRPEGIIVSKNSPEFCKRELNLVEEVLDLCEVLHEFSEEDQILFQERFCKGLTLKEIGKTFHISHTGVGYKLKKLLNRLRKRLK